MALTGQSLLQGVASRIIRAYLSVDGAAGAMLVDEKDDPARFAGVDLVYNSAGMSTKAKIKADPYFGTDPRKIADHDLGFYRASSNAYAFETIAHAGTREAGWVFSSMADELFYYFFVLGQPEEEVAALMEGPDEVFLSELAVERDELHVLPMPALRRWFEANNERYTPRPITQGAHMGWFRIIPVEDVDGAVPGVQVRGSIFSKILRV